MVEVIDLFQNITNAVFNKQINLAFILIVFTTLIVIYSIIIFYFYKFLSKKNILELDLYQYNQYENPTLVKITAIIFYFFEYLIILPVLTFFWFTLLSVMLMLLSPELRMETVLLISASFVASVRVVSYINKGLSTEIAKIVPFTFLVIAVTTTDFFNLQVLLTRIYEIPNLFTDIIYFLVFIMVIEIVMRVADVITKVFDKSED
ncbi:MAG: hypothetical protein Q8N88_04805 [Nanoarchaeota archaeon]|nr:hypothetical protein [Nanoarchaeota archaeon]